MYIITYKRRHRPAVDATAQRWREPIFVFMLLWACRRGLEIKKRTKLGTLGSCFAQGRVENNLPLVPGVFLDFAIVWPGGPVES